MCIITVYMCVHVPICTSLHMYIYITYSIGYDNKQSVNVFPSGQLKSTCFILICLLLVSMGIQVQEEKDAESINPY